MNSLGPRIHQHHTTDNMLSKIKRGLGRGVWVWHGLFVRNFSWDILMNKKRKYLTGDMETHVQCPVCPGPPSQCLHSLQTGSGLVLLRAMSGQENCNIYHVEHSHIFSKPKDTWFSFFLDDANNLWDRVIEYLSDMIMSKLLGAQQTWQAGSLSGADCGWSPLRHSAMPWLWTASVMSQHPGQHPPPGQLEKILLSLQLLKQTFQQTRQRSNLIKCCKSESDFWQ